MQIATIDVSQTMSSREISELTGSSHDNVLKGIRRLVLEGVVFKNDTPYTNEQNGQIYTQFVLDFRNTMVVVSGYSAEIRARIIDRWQELEAKQTAPKLPQTMAQALRLAADQAEQIEFQQLQIENQKPAVAFVEKYVESTGLKGFREVCKLLKANEARFREFVISCKAMYRLGGTLTAHQNHIDAGRFEVRTGVADSEHAYTTTKFTSKGIAWIAGEWGKHQISGEAS